ncbi:hypothetical protein D1BOALGB6SA_4557 [Olavius sp. associated proteobacterium Delta 1]|nr:hypothetical protein D1BOALGB6SA_4557 [Olavius sp. associated proteobacterium Delta 1]
MEVKFKLNKTVDRLVWDFEFGSLGFVCDLNIGAWGLKIPAKHSILRKFLKFFLSAGAL